jgi:hypothetical protein
MKIKRIEIKRTSWFCLAVAALVAALAIPQAAHAQAEDFLPRAVLTGIPVSTTATPVGPTITLQVEGSDPDGSQGLPARMRFLLKRAVALDGTEINSQYQYENHLEELIYFPDPDWSEWTPYPQDPDDAVITFSDLEDDQYYLVAVQVMDEDGAVSLERGYGQAVINFQVRLNYFRPEVMVHEYYLGFTSQNTGNDIASGQPLNFSWVASAEAYGGTIVSYRHGFDLLDPEDPNDPGWAVPPGLLPQNMFAEEQVFMEGYHIFTLRVVDDSGQVRSITWQLNVVPFVSPEYQLPLMLVDQVIDSNSNAWPGEGGSPAYDNQDYRDAYWQFLAGAGGVANFDWQSDRFDHTEMISLQDIVRYRAVLIYARAHSSQLLFNQFRPVDHVDKYVWLVPYQERGGNVFLVGARSMESFLENEPNYMVPILYESTEEWYSLMGVDYIVGFGTTILPDGSEVLRGPRQYPYATAGVSLLDWSVPVDKHIYARYPMASEDRKAACAGLKSLVLDPAFRDNHQVAPGAMADTIATDPLINWQDVGLYELENTFVFTGDEFIDANISSRPTPWSSQECPDGPGGYCVEPMFTGQARFDWVREGKWAEGDTDWPYSEFNSSELEQICGPMSLTAYGEVFLGSARTNGLTYGFMSYKNVADKPSGKADVYWGFDPYRFDHQQTRNAIRWVLDYFGLQLNP